MKLKHESTCLVLDQGYSVHEACTTTDMDECALRHWVKLLGAEWDGITPVASKALTPDQQRIHVWKLRSSGMSRRKRF